MRDLSGKVAVITGAGGGLGSALASACARRGMRLALADLDAAAAEHTAAQVRDEWPGIKLVCRQLDVSRLDQMQALADDVCSTFGGAQLLFNNAGVGVSAPVWQNTAEDWAWVTSVNLYGVAWGIRAFVPVMLRQGEGHIVNVASAAGWFSPAGTGVYNASKAAVVALSESLANDLALAGAALSVSVVSPAYFPSGLADSARNRPTELADTVDEECSRRHEEIIRKALQAGPLSAGQIAESTLTAVEEGRFYVFPHDWIPDAIAARSRAAREGLSAFRPQT